MANLILKILLSLLIIIFLYTDSYSWDKEKTEDMIKKTELILTELDNDLSLKEFIPSDIYAESIINIRNSRNHMENKELNLAYFYALVSSAKLETASYLAKAKKNRYQKILFERDIYKKNVSKNNNETKCDDSNYKYITHANLFKKDNIFRIEILDKDLFDKSNLTLSNKGKNSINKIIDVLKKYQKSKLKIIGHTSFNDYNKLSSKKSLFIKNYFINNGIDSAKIELIGAGNTILMYTAVGFRRIDRIELLIEGID